MASAQCRARIMAANGPGPIPPSSGTPNVDESTCARIITQLMPSIGLPTVAGLPVDR
jgi:hypothetical protein